ncbi:MAG: O-antigen ligase family protein [Candidatus Omnitrophica bacterium]|nr:O-antigen ligase family protein [Candidatus Omnitrophota bacterium]
MSFILLLLYLFCTFIRPQDWVQGVLNWRLVNYLAIATVFFIFIERMGRGKVNLVRAPQNILMVGFFGSILMSHIAHHYFHGLIAAYSSFIVIFLLFFIVENCINTERKFKIAVWFIVLLISSLVLQGIYQFQHGYGWAGQPIIIEGLKKTPRITWVSIFNDPNDLALTFAVASGIVLAFIFGKARFFQRAAAIVLLGYLFYGIYLTNSRGGLLALMATIFFYAVIRTRKFFLGGVIGVLGSIAVFAFGPSREALMSAQEASANERIQLWYQGILMLKSNPLFGVGYNMFANIEPLTAHNSYVLAAAELGLVGLFFWMALIYSSFKGFALVARHDEGLKTYALGLQSGLVGFCAAAFFLSRTYVILPYLIFALSGSLLYIAHERNEEIKLTFDSKDFRKTFFLCVGVLLLIYILIKVGIRG